MRTKTCKVFFALFVAFATTVSFIGCKNTNTPVSDVKKEIITTVDDETTLTIMAKTNHSDPDATSISLYMDRIFELYNQKTGKKIKPVLIHESEFSQTASKLFAENKIPDMMLHFNDTDLAKFDIEKNFYYLDDESWVSDLMDAAKAYCSDSNGNLLGLPFWESSLSGCYYNKTLLSEIGFTQPVTNQTEFDNLCRLLSNGNKAPIFWPGNGCNWMFQFGLDPVFADKPSNLMRLNKNEIKYADIPEVKNMVEWFKKANDSGWFNADFASKGWDDMADALGNGDAAMMFAWDSWFSTDLPDELNLDNKANNPNAKYKYTIKDFALMPVFMGTAPEGTYEGGNLNMIMVNKNGRKKDLALEFLNFCMQPENYNFAFDGVSTLKCFKRQTTNVQAKMVTDAEEDIHNKMRPSTAWSKIIGYSQADVGAAILNLFQGKTDVAGCIKQMDDSRLAALLPQTQPQTLL